MHLFTDTAGTRADLAAILAALRRSAPPRGQFPCSADDLDPIHEQFILHADSKYIVSGRDVKFVFVF